jgi:hypothetical protein
MFSTFLTTSFFMLLAIQGVLSEFTITEPTLIQCKPASITWEAKNGPYNVIVVSSSDMCGDPLFNLGDHQTNHITWTVTTIAGTSVAISVENANGDEAWTGTIVVGPSDDTSCLPANERANATTVDAAAVGVATGTTLVVPPSTTTGAHVAGAANAGLNPLGSSARPNTSITISTLCITALFGIVSMFL